MRSEAPLPRFLQTQRAAKQGSGEGTAAQHPGEVEVAEATRRLVQILDVVSASEPNLDRDASGLVRVRLRLRVRSASVSDRPRPPARTGRAWLTKAQSRWRTATDDLIPRSALGP